jgi:2-aminoadipate transaminase
MARSILYDFAKGHPNNHELPVEELQDLFRSIDDDSLRRALQYGQEQGNSELIVELQTFIERQCAKDIGVENSVTRPLFITEGVSHGIDLLTAAVTQPGDTVLTERPTYFLIAGIFRSHGLVVGTMPMRTSDYGIDLDALECEFLAGTRPIPRLIYIIPSYQNPTGCSMSNDDRLKLATLAFKYEILVVADEVYHLLDWGDQPRSARMVTWNSKVMTDSTIKNNLHGCVSVSSFTKIFGPGVRCGWIEADTDIVNAIQNIGYIQSQGAVGPVMGSVLKTGLSSGTVDRVLQRLRTQYRERCNLLCDKLEHELAIKLICRPTGGYFIWIRFPCSMKGTTNSFLEYCLEHGVRFMPGHRCDSCPVESSLTDTNNGTIPLHSYARLCFAKLNSSEIEEGAKKFIDCFHSYMTSMES